MYLNSRVLDCYGNTDMHGFCCHSVKKITQNVDENDKEELQPNGLSTVAFCTVIHGMC